MNGPRTPYGEDPTEGPRPRMVDRSPVTDIWVLADAERPDMFYGPDGRPLFYSGEVNSLIAHTGVGKTMMAIDAATQFLLRPGDDGAIGSAGGKWAYWNFDSSMRDVANRLRSFSFGPAVVGQGGMYYERNAILNDPDRVRLLDAITHHGELSAMNGDRAGNGPWVQDELVEWADGAPLIVVIDTVEASGCPSTGDGIDLWWDCAVRHLARERNVTVLLLDHVPKSHGRDKEKDGLPTPIGSQAKLARVKGSCISLGGVGWSRDPLAGERSAIRGIVAKDREGFVGSKGDACLSIEVGWDVLDDHDVLRWKLRDPATSPNPKDEALAERIHEWLVEVGGAHSANAIDAGVKGDRQAILRVLKDTGLGAGKWRARADGGYEAMPDYDEMGPF